MCDCVCFICVGRWRTAFQPGRTSMQEFYINETTTVMAPLMTHTGQYHYLNDKVNQTQRCFQQEDSGILAIPTCCPLLLSSAIKVHRCTIVKLPLSKRSSMLLVLPHEWADLHNVESKLPKNIISDWIQNLSEGWILHFFIIFLPLKSFTPLHNMLIPFLKLA